MVFIIIGTTPTIIFNKFQTVSPSDFRVADLTVKVAGQILIERTVLGIDKESLIAEVRDALNL